jgi:hypothetical protein
MTPSSLLQMHGCFGGSCFLELYDRRITLNTEAAISSRNSDSLLPEYTASQPRREWSSYSLLWEHQISHFMERYPLHTSLEVHTHSKIIKPAYTPEQIKARVTNLIIKFLITREFSITTSVSFHLYVLAVILLRSAVRTTLTCDWNALTIGRNKFSTKSNTIRTSSYKLQSQTTCFDYKSQIQLIQN